MDYSNYTLNLSIIFKRMLFCIKCFAFKLSFDDQYDVLMACEIGESEKLTQLVGHGTESTWPLALRRYWLNFKKTENSMVSHSVQSLQEFDAKEMYLHLSRTV